jgi:hypothetical protein
MKSCAALIVALSMLSMAGCGGPSPVSAGGTITYLEKPVASASVQFVPTGQGGGKDRQIATGETDAAGKFTVGTVKPGDGAVPGDYAVAVTPKGPATTAGNYELPSKPPFPAHYSDATTSSLKVTVKRGDANQFKLELKD